MTFQVHAGGAPAGGLTQSAAANRALVSQTISRIVPACAQSALAAQRTLDGKTKPRDSLGRLEELACRIIGMWGGAVNDGLPTRALHKAIVIMGADHGVATEGVSAYPQSVTRQMLANFTNGGAAINVLAKLANARLVVVDMGIVDPLPPQMSIVSHRIGPGTNNFATSAAMSADEAHTAIAAGMALAKKLVDDGVTVIGLGEMGIGNSTAASAITSALLEVDPWTVTGNGTGINADAYARKVQVIEDVLARHRPNPSCPLDVLCKIGGFEIAGLVGLTLGAAAHRVPVLMDGLTASAAALLAVRFAPAAREYLIAAHSSVEPGHAVLLEALGDAPLLDLRMRLGEGTGVALAMQLVDAALGILTEMATFDAAGVSRSQVVDGGKSHLLQRKPRNARRGEVERSTH